MMSSMDKMNDVVCPKPRRAEIFNASANEHVRRQQEAREAEAAAQELLDILLRKGASGVDQQASGVAVASSPPFFVGSPPKRVSNPLVHDARFGDENVFPVSPRALGLSPMSSARNGGCVRANFGNNPAVRVEGFDCLDRDRRSGGIPTVA